MENKNIESTMTAEQQTIMQNEILARSEDMPQDRVDAIMSQASRIAVEQISSQAQNIPVEAEGILAEAAAEDIDTGVVAVEAELSAQDRHKLNEDAARYNWDEDRIKAVEASLLRR